MGSLFTSSSGSRSSGDAMTKEAFKIGKPAYQQAVTGGLDFYNQYFNNPTFTGQRVADLNPFNTGSANTLGNFAGQFTPVAQQGAAGLGFANLGSGINFGNNAQNIFSQFSGDPTEQIIANAGQYANNPFVDGLINASSRDVVRNLYENQLPGIDRAASGGGNLNSTRAGVESAIAQRGAADRLSDMSSEIRSKFFGQGLDASRNQYNQNLQNMLAANNDLMRAGQFGLDALGTTQNMASMGFNQGQAAGDLFRNYDQSMLDADKAQFDEGMGNRAKILELLSGLGTSGSAWKGGASSSTQTSTPSMAEQIGRVASIAAPFFSDIRMKENVSQVGKLASGLSVYEYEYKPEFKDLAGHGKFIGVMAQEVEQVIPEAVSVADNGYMMVDYSKVN
jgi:hypothetical protein